MSAKDQTETDGRGRFARKRAAADAPRQRSLGSLRMVWQAGTRYPGHVALAILALCTFPPTLFGLIAITSSPRMASGGGDAQPSSEVHSPQSSAWK